MDLNDWLKMNNDVIVDLARKYVPTEIIKEPTFKELATLLMGKFVHRHGSEEEVGKRSQSRWRRWRRRSRKRISTSQDVTSGL